MHTVKRTISLFVLALWGVAAMHCTLEAVPGFEFLKCCCFVEKNAEQSRNCDDDGCATVESGDYRLEERTACAPQPLLLPVCLTPLEEEPFSGLVSEPLVCKPAPPPELSHIWQFSFRAALPPRAPSLLS